MFDDFRGDCSPGREKFLEIHVERYEKAIEADTGLKQLRFLLHVFSTSGLVLNVYLGGHFVVFKLSNGSSKFFHVCS